MSKKRNHSALIRSGRAHPQGPVAPRTRIKHGATVGSPNKEYRAWSAMWTRCTNPKGDFYARYGGRGIVVCERWNDFRLFLEDVGPAPSPAHSIDRINVDGNYEPGNVRWASGAMQQQNRKSTKLSHEIAAQIRAALASGTATMKVAAEFGISNTMVRKIRSGTSWSVTP